MNILEQNITQDPTEPVRRFFSDSRNYDFLIWYKDPEFKHVVGFQIGYKPSPFNTSQEYFLTLKPNASQIKYGTLTNEGKGIAASKIIGYLEEKPSAELLEKIKTAAKQLPADIQEALAKYI